eukprot:gene46427-894_t
MLLAKSATVSSRTERGGVGCGKSFLADLFYDKARVRPKQRVHFNAFMLDVHARIHALKKADKG